eukprot:10660937-Lingulodinium_polyedra.AAC.1
MRDILLASFLLAAQSLASLGEGVASRRDASTTVVAAVQLGSTGAVSAAPTSARPVSLPTAPSRPSSC